MDVSIMNDNHSVVWDGSLFYFVEAITKSGIGVWKMIEASSLRYFESV